MKSTVGEIITEYVFNPPTDPVKLFGEWQYSRTVALSRESVYMAALQREYSLLDLSFLK